jgi:hypothetical protein
MESITIYLLSNVFPICFMGHEFDLRDSKLRLVNLSEQGYWIVIRRT